MSRAADRSVPDGRGRRPDGSRPAGAPSGGDGLPVEPAAAPYALSPGEAEVRRLGDTTTRFLATGALTGGAFALVDEQATRGESVPRHLHADDVESFYVLDGEITFYLGHRPGIRAGAGAFVHVPAGAVHGFRIESDRARYLMLTTPRHGDFYRAISLPVGPDGAPMPDPAGGRRIREACEEYGIEFVGPLPPADASGPGTG